MATTTLNRYIPEGYDQCIKKDFGIECHYSLEKLCAIMYHGRRKNKTWHYKYSSEERMMEAINASIDRITSNSQSEVDRRARNSAVNKAMLAMDEFEEGDIIVNSWGYEQTNVEFYQVITVLKKKIQVHQIGSNVVPGSEYHDSCKVTPDKDGLLENKEPFLLSLRARVYNEETVIDICNPKSYYHFKKWGGNPQYKSWGY